jgi:hypothetical protein
VEDQPTQLPVTEELVRLLTTVLASKTSLTWGFQEEQPAVAPVKLV